MPTTPIPTPTPMWITDEHLAKLKTIAQNKSTGPGLPWMTRDEFLQLLAYIDTLKRDRFLTESGRTHWTGCYVDHYRCAMRRIEELEELTGIAGEQEQNLRYEWWHRHGCDTSAMYGDDGKMNCTSCFTDFKNMAFSELGKRVNYLRLRRAN